jgi:hypothetical protein
MEHPVGKTRADAGKVLVILRLTLGKREKYKCLVLPDRNATQQTGPTMLDGKDTHAFGKAHFRELQREVVREIVSCVTISQKMGIKPNDKCFSGLGNAR